MVMKILSLGWGVQSFTLAAMVALGELEPVDYAVHSDTTHERSDTYLFAEKYTPWLEARDVKVVTVVNPNTQVIDVSTTGVKSIPFPAFTRSTDDNVILISEEEYIYQDGLITESAETGRMIEVKANINGQVQRQCTGDWKIVPMRRWFSAELDRLGMKKEPGVVELWLGISMDEATRMKDSNVKYVTHRWPLIDKRMSRWACIQWLQTHGLEIPPKSACVFCPYHNSAAWRELKSTGNGDWHKAVEVDRAIRKARPPYDLFVHPSRRPLEEIDLSTPEDNGQLSLWDNECEGICGV